MHCAIALSSKKFPKLVLVIAVCDVDLFTLTQTCACIWPRFGEATVGLGSGSWRAFWGCLPRNHDFYFGKIGVFEASRCSNTSA